MEGFRKMVDVCGFCDLEYQGRSWTFEKWVAGGGHIGLVCTVSAGFCTTPNDDGIGSSSHPPTMGPEPGEATMSPGRGGSGMNSYWKLTLISHK